MSFLSDVAEFLLTKYQSDIGKCTIVSPNKRVGIFLKKIIAQKVEKPIWSPIVQSLEEFMLGFSEIKKADTLTLIFELYISYKEHKKNDEGFDSFYPWGEMLLHDFEDVDAHLVNPKQLFTYIKNDKQLSEDFHYLDKEQEKIIQSFWQNFFTRI